MKKVKYMVKALVIVSILLSFIGLAHLGAQREYIPSLKAILTSPISKWAKNAHKEEEPTGQVDVYEKIKVQSITPAPELRMETVQFEQMAAQKNTDPGLVETSSDETPKSDSHTNTSKVTEAQKQNIDNPVNPIDASEAEAEMSDSSGDLELKESVSAAEDSMDPASASERLFELLRTGGELVEEGRQLPWLNVTWTVDDINTLCSKGYGIVVAEWNGQLYRVIPKDNEILRARQFIVLSSQALTRISNRRIPLNNRKPSRSVFRVLENRLLTKVGSRRNDEAPILGFFPTRTFDEYLARKQLGAIADLGISVKDLEAGEQSLGTYGEIVIAVGRPMYLIHQVLIDGRLHDWRDPEKVLLAKAIKDKRRQL
jgi:hypothetical protein